MNVNYHKIPIRMSFRKELPDGTNQIEVMDFQSAYEADGYLYHKFDTDMGFLKTVLDAGGYSRLTTKSAINFLNSISFTHDIKIERLVVK